MEQVLAKDPANPWALYGRARSLDALAEIEKSNSRLEQAIFAYRAVLDLEEAVDDVLYRKAAHRCIDRMRFRGTVATHQPPLITSFIHHIVGQSTVYCGNSLREFVWQVSNDEFTTLRECFQRRMKGLDEVINFKVKLAK